MFIELFICNPNEPDDKTQWVRTLFNLDFIGIVQADRFSLTKSRVTYEVQSPEPNAESGSIEFLVAHPYDSIKDILARKIIRC